MVPLGLGEWFAGTALSGSLLLAVPIALVAGLVSFFSPCVVPLLPGYLSYATGLSGADLEHGHRGRMLAGTSLFVLGFSAVFVAMGTLSGALLSVTYSMSLGTPFVLAGLGFRRMLGAVRWVRRRQVWITRAGGIMLVAVGLLLVSGVWDLWVAYLRGWVGTFSVVV